MLRLFLAAALTLPLAGCPAPTEVEAELPGGLVVGSGTPAARSPELDAARERWRAAGMEGYQMTLRRICFCPVPDYTGPFTVTVRDGDLASVTLDGGTVDPERGETVEDLFDLIEDAYERKAESVTVAFDPTLGYPTDVSIDYSMQMADEEIGYSVSGLRRL